MFDTLIFLYINHIALYINIYALYIRQHILYINQYVLYTPYASQKMTPGSVLSDQETLGLAACKANILPVVQSLCPLVLLLF